MASGEPIRVQPPTSITVFGILNLVFGALGMCGAAASAVFILMPPPTVPNRPNPFLEGEGPMAAWLKISLLLGLVATAVLIASGIGLLRMRPWGQKLAIGYSIYAILSSILGIALQIWMVSRIQQGAGDPQAPAVMAGAVGGAFGGCIGLIYPILLWYFMTRPNVVAAFAGSAAARDPYGTDFTPPAEAAGLDLNNPYAAPQTASAAPVAYAPPDAGSVVDTFIPAKNGPALASYYLGLFSLLPCFGFPLGVAAVYLGIKGLRNVRAHPEVRGGAHAWVGVICGGLFGLFNFVLLILFVIGMVAAATQR
jgi:hypothetical protein